MNGLFKLNHFLLVPFQGFVLKIFCLFLVLDHPLIPVLVEFAHFFDVCSMELLLLIIVSAEDIVFALSFELEFHLGEFLLGHLCFHVLSSFFALFLMGVEDFHVVFEITLSELGQGGFALSILFAFVHLKLIERSNLTII